MEFSLEYALEQDRKDLLKKFRQEFLFPQHEGKPVIYLTGNSLGLQPKKAKQYIEEELSAWAEHGVEGHFLAKRPWVSYHEHFSEHLAKIVGAEPSEVVAMNQLTVNLHVLLTAFYKPTTQRYKIICETKAFPSDQYALASQVELNGFTKEEAIIEITPNEGDYLISTEKILATIEAHKNDLALVMIGGVNYFTGQLFDIEKITKAAHAAGAICGWDLAHAAGNAPLKLNAWSVDFACWCSYKYMNSGPGSVAGVYVHEKYHQSNIKHFAGWWGHDKASRFKMDDIFIPIQSAERFQLSNAPIFIMAPHLAALELFSEAGFQNLRAKSEALTAYLEFIILEINKGLKAGVHLEIITPKSKSERGCQLSIIAHGLGKELHAKLTESGVVTDWREPNVIRMAPVPLYNSFEDVYRLGEVLKNIIA
jgi:kynureninase